MRHIIILSGIVLALNASAEPWQFGEKLSVTENAGERVFHHLDSTGRNNIAFSGDTLAVVWEDNHAGTSQVYIAFKGMNENSFSKAKKLSNSKTAFSPVVISAGEGQFIVAWEQDNGIWSQMLNKANSGKALQLSNKSDRQVSITKLGKQKAVAVWVRQEEKFGRIMSATIRLDKNGAPEKVTAIKPVDSKIPADEQLYPVICKIKDGALVAWEDRRHGHTVLLSSKTRDGAKYTAPVQINESVQKSTKYGRGSGVTRLALTEYEKSGIAATWMDKRGFKTGYDIYAAFSSDATGKFSKNAIVQDPFGDNLTQWNPAIAGNTYGDVVVSWDDDRNETSDVWISWKSGEEWSDDYLVPPASEAKQQTNAVISFDDKRNLHIVWIEQEAEFGPTKIYYAVGSYNGS